MPTADRPVGTALRYSSPNWCKRLPPTTARSSGRRTGLPTPWSATSRLSPARTCPPTRLGRHPAPQRPRRAEPVHGSQGLHRMREHAQRTRRREGHQRALAAARRPGHRRFDQRLPRRQVTTGPPIRPRQPAARHSKRPLRRNFTSPSFTWKAPGWSILLPSFGSPASPASASGPYRETTTEHPVLNGRPTVLRTVHGAQITAAGREVRPGACH